MSGSSVTDDVGVRPPGRRAPSHLWRRVEMVVGAWIALIVVASIVHDSWAVHRGALFLHLGGLVAGFGAVLVADLHGVLWLTGRRRLGDIVLVIQALHPVIWTGLIVLVVSGMFLEPKLSLPRTSIKLVLVLLAAINGLWAHRLSQELSAQRPEAAADEIDQRLLLKVMASGALSQTAWWGATLIGFLATTSR